MRYNKEVTSGFKLEIKRSWNMLIFKLGLW